MTPGRRRGSYEIPAEEAAIVGINIRTLRRGKGWSQRQLGELMDWSYASTVCSAEGHRSGRQRRFTVKEVWRLAAIFHVSYGELTTRCANCNGQPPAGFACLACRARSGTPDQQQARS
jgi:transcriptional regulator with XRE-family HTH domain